MNMRRRAQRRVLDARQAPRAVALVEVGLEACVRDGLSVADSKNKSEPDRISRAATARCRVEERDQGEASRPRVT
jgi:hypothetical protein